MIPTDLGVKEISHVHFDESGREGLRFWRGTKLTCGDWNFFKWRTFKGHEVDLERLVRIIVGVVGWLAVQLLIMTLVHSYLAEMLGRKVEVQVEFSVIFSGHQFETIFDEEYLIFDSSYLLRWLELL
jgi:hypothetical protein